jgi:hypothetical protein
MDEQPKRAKYQAGRRNLREISVAVSICPDAGAFRQGAQGIEPADLPQEQFHHRNLQCGFDDSIGGAGCLRLCQIQVPRAPAAHADADRCADVSVCGSAHHDLPTAQIPGAAQYLDGPDAVLHRLRPPFRGLHPVHLLRPDP